MCEIVGSLILGAFFGGSVRKVSWRPLVRGGIREGLRAQRKLAEFGSSVRTEAQQLVAEARDELNRSGRTPDSSLSSNL